MSAEQRASDQVNDKDNVHVRLGQAHSENQTKMH